MSLDFKLKGVHVLITGAAGGIGLEILHTFKELGARVTAHYNTKIGELAEIDGIVTLRADVRHEDSIEALFQDAALQNGGPVAILVVNHGYAPPDNTPVADMDLSHWQNTVNINMTGPFLLAKHFMRQLRTAPDAVKEVANIVFIGSTAGKFGEANHADYAASKSGVMYGLTLTLKNEIVSIAPRARVNCVNPGWTATPKKESVLKDQAFVGRVLATMPLQKVAEPRDIANQVAVVASPYLSSHVNGTNVMVDGGMEGRLLFPPKVA